jgi:superfamily II DNA or RNA helicase
MGLRHYQDISVNEVRAAYLLGYNAPLLVLPTGGGKTVCFTYICQNAAAKGKRVLILAHRTELIYQASGKLAEMGVRHGCISPDFPKRYREAVQVASVQTLVNRLGEVGDFDLIIIDEGHHAPAGTWADITAAFPKAKILGVTATPIRSDGKGLALSYDHMVVPQIDGQAINTRWLMDRGYLSEALVLSPNIDIDFKSLRKGKDGDYTGASVTSVFDKPSITGDAVNHYRTHANGLPAIAFCASVSHAQSVADDFAANGYRVGLLAGKLKKEERKALIMGLANGKYQILCACDMVSEGTDIPVCAVAILMRPTSSLGLHLQQVGRVLRPVYAAGMPLDTAEQRLEAIRLGPKPRAIIIDMAGNVGRWQGDIFVEKHGFPDTEWEWSLDTEKPVERKNAQREEPKIQSTICLKCYAHIKPVAKCPMCGTPRPIKERQIVVTEGELKAAHAAVKQAEATAKAAKTAENKDVRTQVFRCRSFAELEVVAQRNGKDKKWLMTNWNVLQGWARNKSIEIK